MDRLMGGVALGACLVFVALAFGARAVVHRRRTGSGGFNGFSGRPGSSAWFAGVLFVAAAAIEVVAPTLQLFGVLQPVATGWPLLAVGGPVALAGIGATLWAQGAMGDSWRVGVDDAETTTLVTGGPFAVVRNPIFSAMITGVGGLTVLAPNPLALLGLAVLIVAISTQIRNVEEPYLMRTHGERYLAYAGRVGRLVPGVGRISASGAGVGRRGR